MTIYKIGNITVHIHGNVNQKNLEEATAKFLKAAKRKQKDEKKRVVQPDQERDCLDPSNSIGRFHILVARDVQHDLRKRHCGNYDRRVVCGTDPCADVAE